MNLEQIKPPASTAAARRPVPSRHRSATTPTVASPSHMAGELVGSERRQCMIAEAAYFRSKHRHFAPGYELEDWLAAETEVDSALAIGLPLAT